MKALLAGENGSALRAFREPVARPRSLTNLVITGGTEYHLIDWIPSFEVVEIRELQPDFEKLNGLVPVIAQDVETGEVLMLAWMNQEAFEETRPDSAGVLL